ncbi:hypothetical protein EYM_06675 [Ignicoccus islandicus DSM 13165]|uniref:TsaA-like domain-containing protein n=1 Tax=Ignicoccus islandicus DSM 13165 TaxID=940295 RepID=A0A0U3DWU0_9CREN|nr:tRNA (N6-threonylcarbamoyladenosine(37)-N6)-methyltransferase TrmO [Ignicoccus islandicus]ALU11962.1 hypothetical protein EYM_06675 [Ignicoccus islandicus DSM 13165]
MNFVCNAIGYVRRREELRAVKGKEEVFREGDELRSKEATIELLKEYCDGLDGIERGSLIWVIWYAHLSKDKPIKVHPFHDERFPEVGVFATRSPARPNPIGLSLCYVIDKVDCCLKVLGLDAVDSTPVLDIKLYSGGLDDPRELLKLVRRK